MALVTGSGGLVGSETVRYLTAQGITCVGIDNDARRQFFGEEASTRWNSRELEKALPSYQHFDIDIRNEEDLGAVFRRFGSSLTAIVHCAAQPSHDWAAGDPRMDFTINANGTLNLLELTRQHCPDATFIYASTNKVYGDRANYLPLVERETRWEIADDHVYARNGIDETMSIDQTKHSLFGVSKTAGDLLVQEYGQYFGMKTVSFRCGCLTGPVHSGTELHGFLAYLMRCAVLGRPYTVFGYKAKQVRDNLHSMDLARAFWHALRDPKPGRIYNMGGGRACNCSMLEAIRACEKITGRDMLWTYSDANRIGDHIWWISDTTRFRKDYPKWSPTYDTEGLLVEIHQALSERLK